MDSPGAKLEMLLTEYDYILYLEAGNLPILPNLSKSHGILSVGRLGQPSYSTPTKGDHNAVLECKSMRLEELCCVDISK